MYYIYNIYITHTHTRQYATYNPRCNSELFCIRGVHCQLYQLLYCSKFWLVLGGRVQLFCQVPMAPRVALINGPFMVGGLILA